jgi:hypothetical protein
MMVTLSVEMDAPLRVLSKLVGAVPLEVPPQPAHVLKYEETELSTTRQTASETTEIQLKGTAAAASV